MGEILLKFCLLPLLISLVVLRRGTAALEWLNWETYSSIVILKISSLFFDSRSIVCSPIFLLYRKIRNNDKLDEVITPP